MFQSFENRARPEDGPPRLARLRAEMAREGLQGVLVPRADVHQGEYVAPRDERLAWLTGFTGSAGFCAALGDRAGVFVDGRYRVQVKSQVETESFTPVPWPETSLAGWLKDSLAGGGVVGFDPWLHGWQEIDRLRRDLDGSGIELRPTRENLVDRIWEDQPGAPMGAVTPYPAELAGESAEEKRARLAADLHGAGENAAVLTLPDSIAWLLNIRGADVPHVPVAHAFAILHADASVSLFIAGEKLDAPARAHLGSEVRVAPPEEFAAGLARLSGRVRLDRASAPVAVVGLLEEAGAEPVLGRDPCILPKARKNAAEIAGAEAAHLADGAAMAEFLSWLDREAPGGGVTEIGVVEALEGFRRQTNRLKDISFETIAGAGPHGAIVHYRVTTESDRPVEPGQLLLVDSGGQYAEGTTDITRTVAVGEAGEEERTCFTRVLQGMIAMSRLRWPRGLAGQHLDAVARLPLWRAGQDYDHGTGHGVGAYLGVHEGPQRLSRVSDIPLEPGMILSNEPGYYREGAFGIRIENLIVVEDAPALPGADAREMLSFRTLTHVPIDRRLIRKEMLDADERGWVDAYHAETLKRLGPRVSSPARAWLEAACAPL